MDEDRHTSDDPLPGNVSNQNAEEQLPEHEGHTENRRPAGEQDKGGDPGSSGAAGEGSQSTGHPENAG